MRRDEGRREDTESSWRVRRDDPPAPTRSMGRDRDGGGRDRDGGADKWRRGGGMYNIPKTSNARLIIKI